MKNLLKKGIATITVACMLMCAGTPQDIYAAASVKEETYKGVKVNAPADWYKVWGYTTETEGGVSYITLSRYGGTDPNVKIPNSAVIGGKKYKTRIGNDALFGFEKDPTNLMVKSLTIEDGVALLKKICSYMFYGLPNCELITMGQLDIPEGGTVHDMFNHCGAKRLNMYGFDTGKLTSLYRMFACNGIGIIDLRDWKNTNVTDMTEMFCAFTGNEVRFSNFNTKNVTNMQEMFDTYEGKTLDVSSFDVSNVTNMHRMFANDVGLETLSLKDWKANKVKSLEDIFSSYTISGKYQTFKKLILGNFEAKSCESALQMFSSKINLEEIEATNIDLSACKNFARMFKDCRKLKKFNWNALKINSAENMDRMFANCEALPSANISSWNIGNVDDVYCMFENCKSLKQITIGNHSVNKLKSLYGMFSGCEALTSLDISGIKTTNTMSLTYMTRDCKNLSSIKLTGNNTLQVKDLEGIFSGCSKLDVVDLRQVDILSISRNNDLGFEGRVLFAPKKIGKIYLGIGTGSWDRIAVKTDANGKKYHEILESNMDFIPANFENPGIYVKRTADGHVWSNNWAVSQKATCKSYEISCKTCLACGEKSYKESSTQYGPHSYGIVKKVSSTYTKQGYTLHKCSICGKEIKDSYKPTKVYSTKIKKKKARSKGFKIEWTKSKGATGYEIQYSTSKGLKASKTKVACIKRGSTRNRVFKKLKANKKYYLRIRAYKIEKVNGKATKSYSSWSKKAMIKTKK